MARRSVPMLSLVLLLGACGGNSSQGPVAGAPDGAPAPAAPQPLPPEPQPTVVTGYFKDARVEGLSFDAGAEQGTTDGHGRFTCEPAGDVEFSVGAVTLGRSACDTVVTPLDLVRDSTLDTPQVLNLVRFLLMLDADGDAGNGIRISQAVRTMAQAWAPVDFAASNFAAEVSNIVDELTTAGTTVVLADESVARAHLAATAACVHTGVYWVSSRSGLWGLFAVYPTEAGGVAASAVVDREYAAPIGSVSYGDVTRVELSEAEGGTVTVEFASADRPVGRRSDGTEAFVAERVAPNHRARYRFVEYSTSSCCVQAFTFELDEGDRVVATSSWFNWWWLPIDDHYEGRVDGDRVTLKAIDGGDVTFEGALDLSAEPPSVRWTYANGSESVTYGCKLG